MRLPKEELKIGKYQLLQRLASGGMGEVFLALQDGPAGFLRKVVIKRMRSPIGENPAFVEMFLNEARLAAMLSHPNVVHILELGQAEDGSWFIAMEHIHGRSLRDVLIARSQHGTPGLPPELAARLCADILRGLHHAHEMRDPQGKRLEIIHRDVSPENILVSYAGTVKVVDFGIAKAVSESSSITHVSQLKGKVPYLAPEQLRLERVDARTDVYATGCLLYEALSGQSAFPIHPDADLMKPDADLMEEVLTATPIPLGLRIPYVPQALEAITLKAMAKSPADRFASAQEMATALEEFLVEAQVRVPPEQVSRFLAELFGPAASTPGPAVAVPAAAADRPDVEDRPTERMASPLMLPPPELSTEPGHTWQLAKPGSATAPPAPRLLGPLPPIEANRASSEAPISMVEAPHAVLAKEPPTEHAVTPSFSPKPARKRLPKGGAPAKPSARRWFLVAGAAVVLGLLMVLGARFLQSRSEPPAAGVSEAPEQASPEPLSAPPTSPPAAEASPVKEQAVSEPSAAAPVRPLTSKDKRTRSPRKGRVILQVQPSAEVFSDARRLGVASSSNPLELELSAGQHTLTLKNAELGVTRRITVKVPARGKTVVKENLGRPASKRP